MAREAARNLVSPFRMLHERIAQHVEKERYEHYEREALLVCHDPKENMASRPGAAPGRLSFGDSAAQAGARLIGN